MIASLGEKIVDQIRRHKRSLRLLEDWKVSYLPPMRAMRACISISPGKREAVIFGFGLGNTPPDYILHELLHCAIRELLWMTRRKSKELRRAEEIFVQDICNLFRIEALQDTRKLFIRFGGIPEDERSGIFDGDRGKVGQEVGVSVYEAIESERGIQILMPQQNLGACATLCGCIDRMPVLEVIGDLVGYGSDGEPLLRNIKIIRQLT